MRMFLSVSGHTSELSIANHSSRSTASQLKYVSDTISSWFENHQPQKTKISTVIYAQPFIQNSNQMASRGAIHSTKISRNFGLKLNGSVRSNRKSFEKSGPPFEVDLFSRLDRSDRNGPFHLTIPIHFQSQDLAVRYLPCTKWRKILITVQGHRTTLFGRRFEI